MSEEWTRAPAVIVGFEDYGRYALLAELLSRYGCQKIVAITNRAAALREMDCSRFVVLEVPDILDGVALAAAVAEVEGFDARYSPFLCVQDRVLLSYLDARNLLLRGSGTARFVDERGIRAARIKPLARALWNRTSVDPTLWTVIDKGLSVEAIEGRLKRAGIAAVRCMVKPIIGMGSEAVSPTPITGAAAVADAAERVFQHWEAAIPQSKLNTFAVTEHGEFALYRQALVEEFLDGVEYTVDGVLHEDQLRYAVQHKETRYIGQFVGDGLIVSPPAALTWGSVLGDSVPKESVKPDGIIPFGAFLRQGLRALCFVHWVFHAEVMATSSGLRFVELNPRPPGGLLARTANVHIGIDPSMKNITLFSCPYGGARTTRYAKQSSWFVRRFEFDTPETEHAWYCGWRFDSETSGHVRHRIWWSRVAFGNRPARRSAGWRRSCPCDR